MSTAAEKTCSRCQIPLARDQFNRRSSSRDGLRPCCRECQREIRRIYLASDAGLRYLREGSRLDPDVRAGRKRRVLATMESLSRRGLAVSLSAIVRLAGPGYRDFRLVRSLRSELIAEGAWPEPPRVVPSLRSRVRAACHGLLDAGTYPDRGRLEPLFPDERWRAVATARYDVLRAYPGPIPATGERDGLAGRDAAEVAEVEAAIAKIRRAKAKRDGATPTRRA
jgi:hypothetical protein